MLLVIQVIASHGILVSLVIHLAQIQSPARPAKYGVVICHVSG
jgi:hypothetical protein